MTEYMSLDDFAKLYYGDARPKTWRQTLNSMCRDGWLSTHSRKLGKKWVIEKGVLK